MRKKTETWMRLPDGRAFRLIVPKGTMFYGNEESFRQYSPESTRYVDVTQLEIQ